MPGIEKIDDTDRFGALREEWNALLNDSGSDCVFLTWEWMFTWWKHLAEDRRLHLLALRHDGELIALAPLTLRASCWRRLIPFPALEFIGSGSVGSDYLDILIRRGRESQALATLAEYLGDSKFMFELARINRTSAHVSGLARALVQQGWTSTRDTTDLCPYINLAGHDWESYLATLGRAHRYNLRRRLRNLGKHGEVGFHRVDSEQQRHECLRQLLRLHRLRWRELGHPGAFDSASLLAFHDEITALALHRGWLRLFLLTLDGQAVAALYGFRYQDTFYFYQSGFDPDFRRHSVGLVTMGLAIKSALEEGVQVYDFLRGDESYKSLWTQDERELIRLDLYPPGERGAFYRQTMGLRCGIKKIFLQRLPGTG